MKNARSSNTDATPEQLQTQLAAHSASILAEGVVLSSFKHKGLSGIEREAPVRRFLRRHLPGRFHVGQGAIASSERLLRKQHDIVIADRDLCFMLLNTLNAQLVAIESVHAIIEVRSRNNSLESVARSLEAVRRLSANRGLRQLGNLGSDIGVTSEPVHTLVLYNGPKPETMIKKMTAANSRDSEIGRRMIIDFILVLSTGQDNTPRSGYLVGYSRTDPKSGQEFAHHLYPQVGETGMDGPKLIAEGSHSFARWYAGLLNHLSGVTVYPPNLYSYLGDNLTIVDWTTKPY